ncbi:MAG: CBS domain-containing protein [Micromonosporaceae bacterium]
MVQKVHEVMTDAPVTVAPQATLTEAARLMREHDIGDVLVTEDSQLRGIVTDRDIVVRAVADARDPTATTVGEVCSRDLIEVKPNDDAERVLLLMRARSVRRIPVIEEGRVVGILSLGDMAVERDPQSVLADISTSDPND